MSTKKEELERKQREKRNRKDMANLYKVGDMVCFKPGLKTRQFKYGVVIEKNGVHFKIEHPSGETHEMWVEQISHKVRHIDFPGLCDSLVTNNIHPTRVDSWIKLLESLKPLCKMGQAEAIDVILRALNWAMPQLEQEEPVETAWEVLLESIPVTKNENPEDLELKRKAAESKERGYYHYDYECPTCEHRFGVQTEITGFMHCIDCNSRIMPNLIDRVPTK